MRILLPLLALLAACGAEEDVFAAADAAAELSRAGRHSAALKRLQALRAAWPERAIVHLRSGEALANAGFDDEAAEALRRALALKPGLVEARSQLCALDPGECPGLDRRQSAAALWAAGDAARAAEDFLLALEDAPDDVALLVNTGGALLVSSQPQRALEVLGRAIAIDPTHARACQYALLSADNPYRPEPALAVFEACVRPDAAPEVLSTAGRLMLVPGDLQRAREAFALAAAAGDAEAQLQLGNVLFQQGDHGAAREALELAVDLLPESSAALTNLGVVLWQEHASLANRAAEQGDRAIALLRRALEVDPGAVDTLRLLGQVLLHRRDLDGAVDAYRRALALRPADGESLALLAEALHSAGASGREVLETEERAIAALSGEDLDHRQSSHQGALHLMLARLLERRGRYREAWAAAQRGNAARATRVHHHSPEGMLRELQGRRALFTPEFVRQLPRRSARSAPTPVFVFGMPRSGTSLVESILARHESVATVGESSLLQELVRELSPLGPGLRAAPLEALAQRYLAPAAALGAPLVLDKMHYNFVNAWLVALLFPDAKLLHVRRDPRDVAVSIYFTEFDRIMGYEADLSAIAAALAEKERLMEHWRRVLPSLQVLELRYEELVADPEGQARRALAFLGLDWDPKCLDPSAAGGVATHTASWLQVRERVHARAVGRWEHFEGLHEFLSRSSFP